MPASTMRRRWTRRGSSSTTIFPAASVSARRCSRCTRTCCCARAGSSPGAAARTAARPVSAPLARQGRSRRRWRCACWTICWRAAARHFPPPRWQPRTTRRSNPMNPSLTDRLRGIIGGAIPRVESGVELRQATPVVGSLDAAALGRAAAVLGGTVVSRDEGVVIAVDRCYGPAAAHGHWKVGEIVDTLVEAEAALETLGRAWPSSRLEDGRPAPLASLLFLDLETTGLAGGAG